MSLVEQKPQVAAHSPAPWKSAALASCATVMQRITQPGIAVAIWERRLAGPLRDELAQLVLDEVDDTLFKTVLDALDNDLSAAMNEAGYPDTPALRDDIASLARRHAAIVGEDDIGIRLEVVETDACRKFHADYVTARCITTYLGQGTQWIEASSPDRAGLRGGPAIEQIETGAVAMFKGRLWQESPTILHRSPPIGASGEQRLVLAIDPAPREKELAIHLEGQRS
jgi:hypothetical protein